MQTAVQDLSEIALDGVRYALVRDNGILWRLGSTNPAWREEIPILAQLPDEKAFEELSARGIFSGKNPPPKLAAMCCGLGSAWPGMGRELYDNFPAARMAMDEIASYADWDILSLMDEKDLDVINQTRNQIPYLFLVEYAQWKQLVSLGLKPDLMCGHSLGELVALCLAGVYDVQAAWLLLDTRASHMASLETGASSQSGMLAVSAGYNTIADILAMYPDLRISNCNTPTQYILGGPREQLMKARKNLRRQRIPAFALNVSLAFHNPAMRVLRDISVLRLNKLEMHPAAIPMLSCVTSGFYPDTQPEICRYIADLDENTVQWTRSVEFMCADMGITDFVELGPRETLCGLVGEISPGSVCLASSRPGHETMAMRQLCARLFALGHLREKAILRQSETRTGQGKALELGAGRERPATAARIHPPFDIPERDLGIILDILASATGRPARTLTADLDLRYDLALRSSRFPRLVQEAETRLGRAVPLESMFQISTVGDLARFLTGHATSNRDEQKTQETRVANVSYFNAPPLCACKWTAAGTPEQLKFNPYSRGLAASFPGPVILCIFDQSLVPQIWAALAPLSSQLAVPAPLVDQCSGWEKAGNSILPISCSLSPEPGEVATALRKLGDIKPSGLLLVPPVCHLDSGCGKFFMEQVAEECAGYLAGQKNVHWFCAIQRATSTTPPGGEVVREIAGLAGNFYESIEKCKQTANIPGHAIFWLDTRANPFLQNHAECGDMLARDILYNRHDQTVWLPITLVAGARRTPEYCPAAPCLDFVWPDPAPELPPASGFFQGECQYSRFANPSFSTHGSGLLADVELNAPQSFHSDPWLPVGCLLKPMLVASRLVAPWLTADGFSDLHISSIPVLPQGVTRECRISSLGRPWILQSGIMTRMCRVNMSLRDISSNGRHLQTWSHLCDGLCLLSHTAIPLARLPLSDEGSAGEELDGLVHRCYDILGFAAPWRLLENFGIRRQTFSACGADAIYEARLPVPKWPIAAQNDWEYSYFIHLIESLHQAGMIALASTASEKSIAGICQTFRQWRCGFIGYLRFDPRKIMEPGEAQLQLRRTWYDEKYVRFDAQICDARNEPVITAYHVEWNRAEPEEREQGGANAELKAE